MVRLEQPAVADVATLRDMMSFPRSRIDREAEVFHLFISYASEDQKDATRLSETLRRQGVRCFMASRGLAGGDDFADRLRDVLIASKELCILATPHSLGSEWVTTELGAAWALGKRITPILLRITPDHLPARLRSLHCIDFEEASRFATELRERWIPSSDEEPRDPRGTGDLDLTRTEERILTKLTHEFDLRLRTAEIAQALRLSLQRARRVLEDLDRRGLIASDGCDPQAFHYITEKGIDAADRTVGMPLKAFRLLVSRQLKRF